MKAYRRKELDGLELRLDAFTPLELTRLHALVVLERRLPPLLLTVRSKREGGLASLATRERIARFKLFMPFASGLDCELSSKDLLSWASGEARRYRKYLILSCHDFKKTPPLANLEKILKHSLLAKPALTKIAVLAKSQNDLLSLITFLKTHQAKGLVVIAMGPAGVPSRVLFPLLGSRITFGSFGRTSAPGQLPVSILKSRLAKIFR
jgi:3-dehydroquinate dehydratase-1